VDQIAAISDDRHHDYAQHELGDVVFAELPAVAQEIVREIRSHGESSGGERDLRAVSGEVTETNSALANAPETVNSDPHRRRVAHQGQIDQSRRSLSLMDAARTRHSSPKREPR